VRYGEFFLKQRFQQTVRFLVAPPFIKCNDMGAKERKQRNEVGYDVATKIRIKLPPWIGCQKVQPFVSFKHLRMPYWDKSASNLETPECRPVASFLGFDGGKKNILREQFCFLGTTKFWGALARIPTPWLQACRKCALWLLQTGPASSRCNRCSRIGPRASGAPRHGVLVDCSFLPDAPCAWEFSTTAR